MRPIVRDFLTGTIAIAGGVGLVMMLGITGELKNLGKKYYDFTVSIDNAGGLSGSSAVLFNGVRIGNIRSVRNNDDPLQGVVIQVHAGADFQIPRTSEVVINQSFVGDVSLEFQVPPTATRAEATDFIKPGENLPFRKATTMMSRITDGIREPLNQLVTAADGVKGFTDEYTKLGVNLNKLVEPATPEQVDAGAAPTVASVLARADRALAGANQWIGDDTLRGDAKGVISSAKATLEKLTQAGESIRTTSQTIDAQAVKVGDQVGTLTESARQTLKTVDDAAADIKAITASINRGEGTAGQIVRNPELYNSLLDASKRLDKALEEFRLLAEKYRTEGLPIKF